MFPKEDELNILQRCFGNVGNHLPHIVDVKWRLDFVVDTSNLENKNDLQYTIQLKTECDKRPDITFVCNESQLDELVYKLKEIVRHCEAMSS